MTWNDAKALVKALVLEHVLLGRAQAVRLLGYRIAEFDGHEFAVDMTDLELVETQPASTTVN